MATVVRAHIAGTVWKVEVEVGGAVTAGQIVVVLESMKMEMPVESPAEGRVAAVRVRPGEAVDEGAALVDLE